MATRTELAVTRVPILVGYVLLGEQREESVAFVLDISKQKRLERDLQEADRRKDEFLAMLGHELRNPLAPLLNGLQVLKLRGVDGETRSAAVLGRWSGR